MAIVIARHRLPRPGAGGAAAGGTCGVRIIDDLCGGSDSDEEKEHAKIVAGHQQALGSPLNPEPVANAGGPRRVESNYDFQQQK